MYLPFIKNPDIVHMGLEKLDAGQWLQPGDSFPIYHDNQTALAARAKAQVYAALPTSEAAQSELATRVLHDLVESHGELYSLESTANGQVLSRIGSSHEYRWHTAEILQGGLDALWQLSFCVEEDLCLLQEQNGIYVLTAASLCCPSGWHLQDKIGRPIGEIHQPVPGLNKAIGRQIDHVFAKLSPLRPFQRFNWSIKGTDALALFPGAPAEKLGSDTRLFLRVERQTLTRLPRTGTIAFTIRVYTYPLDKLRDVDGAVAALRDAVHGMSPEEVRYKGILPLFTHLRRFFKSAARG